MAGYTSTDCRSGYHQDCRERQIVPGCACSCHDHDTTDEDDVPLQG